jgi:hypothetical protein
MQCGQQPPNEVDDNEVDDEAARHATGLGRGGFCHGFANFGCARHIPIGGGGGFDAEHSYQDGDEDMLFDMDDHRHGGHDGYHERRHANPDHRRDDDGLGKVKVSIPKFSVKKSADDYFEWETKVDQIFDLYTYPPKKKAKLAAIEFTGYAITWWNQVRAKFYRVEHDHIT